MMKIRLICFGLILNYLICHTYAQVLRCNSIEGYNTKDLTSASQWQVTTSYQCLSDLAAGCSFYISFCKGAPACPGLYSACENATIATTMTIIGGVTSHPFFENESGPKGFYAQFPSGPLQNVTNSTSCEPSLRINFNCNLNAQWLAPVSNGTASAPQPTKVELDGKDPCLTIMTFDYAGACYYGKEPDKGIGGGAIFLIILFSVALAYFIIGVAYNGLVKHKSGVNLLPQAQFWIGLPVYAIEGCRSIITCCSGASGKSAAAYESV